MWIPAPYQMILSLSQVVEIKTLQILMWLDPTHDLLIKGS